MKITGFVESFAQITPDKIQFKGTVGEKLTQTIKIIPRQKYPFQITDITMRKGDFLKTDLKEEKVNDTTQYILLVENTKNEVGSYIDRINLKTDNKEKPMISIPVKCEILKK